MVMRGYGRVLAPIAAATAVVVMCSCSAGASQERADSPVRWRTCNDLIGSTEIDALQDEMGDGTMRPQSYATTAKDWVNSLAGIAKRWEPGSGVHYSNNVRPCDLAIEKTTRVFRSTASWSVYSLQEIRSGQADGEWQAVGGDAYLQSKDGGMFLDLIVSCEVQGGHEEQESDLPLEVRVEVMGVPDFKVKVLREIAENFTKSLVSRIPCVNHPDVQNVI